MGKLIVLRFCIWVDETASFLFFMGEIDFDTSTKPQEELFD